MALPLPCKNSILWEVLQAIFSQHSRNVLVLDSNLSLRKWALFVLVQKNLNLAAVKHFCHFTKILVHTNQATENHSLQRFNFRVQSVAAILKRESLKDLDEGIERAVGRCRWPGISSTFAVGRRVRPGPDGQTTGHDVAAKRGGPVRSRRACGATNIRGAV